MKIIEVPLTQGKIAFIDEADAELVLQYRWCCSTGKYTWYAQASIQGEVTLMHRLILAAGPGLWVDHRDHNGLNNTRSNIRVATPSENLRNKKRRSDSQSRFKGIISYKTRNGVRWKARVRVNGKCFFFGCFDTDVNAALAYDCAARKYFGEFAYLNFPLKR